MKRRSGWDVAYSLLLQFGCAAGGSFSAVFYLALPPEERPLARFVGAAGLLLGALALTGFNEVIARLGTEAVGEPLTDGPESCATCARRRREEG